MQKIVYIDDKYTNEINEELSKGWKVISVSPVSTHTGDGYTCYFGAYVVLEKEEGNTTITPYISSESQKVDINVNIKEKPYVVSHYSFDG